MPDRIHSSQKLPTFSDVCGEAHISGTSRVLLAFALEAGGCQSPLSWSLYDELSHHSSSMGLLYCARLRVQTINLIYRWQYQWKWAVGWDQEISPAKPLSEEGRLRLGIAHHRICRRPVDEGSCMACPHRAIFLQAHTSRNGSQ